jgi:hypothetical protein
MECDLETRQHRVVEAPQMGVTDAKVVVVRRRVATHLRMPKPQIK